MELELKASPTIKVKYEGKSYDLSKPNMAARIEFEKAFKKMETSEESPNELVVNLIAACGIPKKILLSMEEDLLNQIFEALAPKKKD